MTQEKIYSVGTLRYTLAGVIQVSFWLLLGAFWADVFEAMLIPTIMPLLFKKANASSTMIGLFLGSIPSFMNFFINPVISTTSDRTRTKWGRRKPYLAVAIPFVAGFGIMLGWIPEIGAWIHSLVPCWSCADCSLVLLCICSCMFYFANLVTGTVGCYLSPDVLPFCVIGRFNAAAKIVYAAAGFLFNFFLMKYADLYTKWLFTGIGILFAICYCLMLLMVKEGEYPPIQKEEKQNVSFTQKISGWVKLYFKDCFSQRIYIVLFLGMAFTQLSTRCRGLFNILFATQDLSMTTEQYGNVMATGSIVTLVIVFSAFLWLDRVNPLLGYMITGIPVVAVNVWGYFCVHDYTGFYINGIAIVIVYTFQGLFYSPLLVMLFPRDKFGQFGSANAMVCCIIATIGSYYCGVIVNHFGTRWIFVWDFAFTMLATLILWHCYVIHKRQTQAEKGTEQKQS